MGADASRDGGTALPYHRPSADCPHACVPYPVRPDDAYDRLCASFRRLLREDGAHADAVMVPRWQTFVDQLYDFVMNTDKFCQDCDRRSFWRTVTRQIPAYEYRGRPHVFVPRQCVAALDVDAHGVVGPWEAP